MLTKIVLAFALMVALCFLHPAVNAQDRYATCDQCGYCKDKAKPQNWNSCRDCLYPGLQNDDTLRIDPATNAPVAPRAGSYYTMLGCISTDVTAGFSGEGAAGSVVQRLINILSSIAGGVAFLYLIYGAFLVLTSQADPERLNQGKRTVYGAIIGVIFVFAAVFLVNIIGGTILKIPGFGS